MKYKTVIGLEVHVQLLTKTKIFCSCVNSFGKDANSQTCPVCLGLPGSLPVFNKEVLDLSIKAALALNCKVAENMKFDRKNYFYPDLPKGYQVSQYDMPLAEKGYLDVCLKKGAKRIGITRLHLEEDAGKFIHADSKSLIDFNRCGVPLIEIVTEPDISSPEEAHSYLSQLKDILKYLEVSDCNMQEGSLRCDANVSITGFDSSKLGVKVEIKNMNSFKAVKSALVYEIKRQTELCNNKKPVVQETRLWNENKKVTISMRSKEEAHDYRYFPEPDLPEFEIGEKDVDKLKKTLPELPSERRLRLVKDYKLSEYDVGVITSSKSQADYFEECLKIIKDKSKAKETANWLMGPVQAELNSRSQMFSNVKLKAEDLVSIIKLVDEGKINAKTAREVILPEVMDGKKSTSDVTKEKDVLQVSDEEELSRIVDGVIEESPQTTSDFKKGKKNAIMYLVGQVMRQTKGKANPKKVNEILKKKLEEV